MDDWSQFKDAEPQTADEADPWAQFKDVAAEPAKPNTALESVAAVARGAARDIPFSQDIGAGLDVARTYLGGHPAGVPTEGPIGERFAAAKERQKAVDEYLTKQHPAYTLAGQIGGAFALPLAGPAGGIAARAAPMVGARAASALGTGAVGAGYGGLYGLGEGDSVGERLRNAGVGATFGGIGGAAIPTIAGGIGRGARYAAEKVGFGDAPSIAGRQLAAAYKTAPGDRAAMTPGQVAEATAVNQPVLPIDVGGQAVKGLAKTAATVSPEARGVLATELYQRTKEQAPRLYDFAENLVGKRLDDPDVIKNLRDTARTYTSPAYKAAMDKGSGGVWNDRLGQLINHPWIKKAIPEAIEESNAAAVIAGLPAAKNPFVVDAAGNYKLPVDAQGNVTRPTLEFWDVLKKNIQGKISGAEPTHATRGDPNTVRIGTQLKNALVNELYSAVPEYQKAVQGAGRYLGEEDAFRFGSKFLKSTDAAAINAGKKAMSSFTPEERELAKHSYMAERLQKYLNRPENQDISKMFSSPAMKAKDVAVLGQEAADKLEAYMLREGLMHNATSALGGSDTMPKLMAAAKFASAHGLGVIGGAGAGAMQGFHESGLEPVNMAKNIASGAMLGWMAQRGLNLADKTALEVAKKLVSNDPAAVQEALNAVAGKPQMLKTLRGAYNASLAPIAPVAARGSVEFLERPQNDRAQRANGGRIGSRDYPAKKLSALDKAARRAHLDISRELEPVMGLPDDVVANALSLAK
jgi:hypothetical protein